MTGAARSAVLFSVRAIQRMIDLALIAAIAGPVVLFGLQFPHSSKLDAVWVIVQLRRFGDPVVAEAGSWFNRPWPSPSTSWTLVPLGVALAIWAAKLAVDALLQLTHRQLGTLIPAPQLVEAADVGPLSGQFSRPLSVQGAATTGRGRDELLKRYREIEQALKTATRKRCTFLSLDIVGSTQMKVGEEETNIAATFQAYEEMLRKMFDQFGAWKQAWTPDGVMVCFLQLDLAVGAAQRALESLKNFNEKENKLRAHFRLRCGLNEGEVPIFEDSKLERIADRVLDVAGHMQKQANANTLWLSAEVFNRVSDKSRFRRTGEQVDGFEVYEWPLDPSQVPARRAAVAASGVSAPSHLVPGKGVEKADRLGRYEIIQELGRGAMGVVYKARDPQIGRTVAIKMVLTASLPADSVEEYKKRFFREAQVAGQMIHPGIVTIHDIAEDGTGQPYLVMEFVEGSPLENLLAPSKSGSGGARLPLKQSLDIAMQVADALDYAHRRGVIHRDIKPANILITTESKAKIADFGIAKFAGTQMTQAGLLVGTPAFMAPEQFTGAGADGRSDIFSLGVMFYWMCTGQKPFTGETLTEIAFSVVHSTPVPARQLNAALPPELDSVISRCLAKKRDDRYPTARDLVTDLEAVKARQTVAAAPPAGAS